MFRIHGLRSHRHHLLPLILVTCMSMLSACAIEGRQKIIRSVPDDVPATTVKNSTALIRKGIGVFIHGSGLSIGFLREVSVQIYNDECVTLIFYKSDADLTDLLRILKNSNTDLSRICMTQG